jgi:hypothetical protein
MKTIEIYSCGMSVLIGGEISATIAEIAIGANDQVQYRCIWIKDQTRCSCWVQDFEIEPNGKEYKTMLKVINLT